MDYIKIGKYKNPPKKYKKTLKIKTCPKNYKITKLFFKGDFNMIHNLLSYNLLNYKQINYF